MTEKNNPTGFKTTKDVLDLFDGGMSHTQLLALIHEGKIKGITFGRRIYIPGAEYQRLVRMTALTAE
ncbi:MAG: hypothetical protein IJ216_06155 [Acidaminococcaceae bacterium]|nr:hypothetical protein [Acidaminococcaceae bacterium]